MTNARVAPAANTEEDRALETRILATRGNISPLYRVLLNSPPVADGWERLLTAVRQKSSLPPALRELIILRVAVLNRAEYEYEAHVPYARQAGLSEAKMAAVKTYDRTAFNELETLVLDYTDTMTQEIIVPDPLFAHVKDKFDARGLVDLTATIAAYNMVSRFLVALHVH